MTSDMAFECLLVSRDIDLFRVINRVLRDLSISTNICLTTTKAFDMLGKGSTDLVIIDWECDPSLELLRWIWEDNKWKKPTVIAISSSHSVLPGAHAVLRKPVTLESGSRCLQNAYSRMLIDYRRHARHVLMVPVQAMLSNGQKANLVITDIGEGGIGLKTKEKLFVGNSLTFRLALPGTPREILVSARVLWTREYDRAGCEFGRIPPVDLLILRDWLNAKSQVKKPLIVEQGWNKPICLT
jgi:CheY-like chemotaxis protein